MELIMNNDENVNDAVAATDKERLNKLELTTVSCFG